MQIKIRYEDISGVNLVGAQTSTDNVINIKEKLNRAAFAEDKFFEFVTANGSIILPIASIISIDILESDNKQVAE